MSGSSAAHEGPRIEVHMSGDTEAVAPTTFAVFPGEAFPAYEISTEQCTLSSDHPGTVIAVNGPLKIVSETRIEWDEQFFSASLEVAGMPDRHKIETVALGLVELIHKHSLNIED